MKIAPSILSADFGKLDEEIKNISSADWVHIDVMDGHFVPNITIGACVVKSIRAKTDMFFDVHLMISDPLTYAKDFANAGADLICFHLESDCDALSVIKEIRKYGKKVGIAVKPKTDIEKIVPFLDQIDMVLVMTVEPGFGGQSFMEDMMPKIKRIRELSKDILIQVDGGINNDTIKIVYDNGANVAVAGSAVFKGDNYKQNILNLRNAIN